MPAHLLVVTTADVSETALDAIVRRQFGKEAEIYVVAPASHLSRLQWLVDDVDGARAKAVEHAAAAADTLSAAKVEAHPGDANPLLAIEDALRVFPAEEIVVVTHDEEDADWLEEGAGRAAIERFALPVTHLVVGDGD